MQRFAYVLSLLLLATVAGCGSGNNTVNNTGLFGDWNIAMYPTGSSNPVYVFALAISQEGTNYSGASITYNGSVAAPSNMCINASSMHLLASTNGNNYTMTITDSSTNTVISVTGVLSSNTSTVTGNYNNAASGTCVASHGTMDMVAQ